MKYTKSLLEKLEGIFKALDFKVRYEKGTFKSGYCLIESQNVVVINKFYPVESKVSTLIEILQGINPEVSQLDAGQTKLMQKINQTELEL